MFKTFDKVISYFKKEHRDYYIVDRERQTVRMALEGYDQVFQVVCSMSELDTVNMAVTQIMQVSKDKIVQACVLANMVNMKTIATFTIAEDGNIMATISLSGKCIKITEKALRCAYLRSFKEALRYYPAFYQLVFGDALPEDACNYIVEEKAGEFKVPYTRIMPI